MTNQLPPYRILVSIGLISLVAFGAVFANIPWEWNMFMDEVKANSWMPFVPDVWAELKKEIIYYWGLGRFYPVKYLANILKWKYLPNDPFVFRSFNLLVFWLVSGFLALSAMRAAGFRLGKDAFCLFVFLISAAILHKPLLEIISLSSIGEGWTCLFIALGTLFLFSNLRGMVWVARIFFMLASLSKEPAALIFLGAFSFHAVLALRGNEKRARLAIQAFIDGVLFLLFLGLALYVLKQGSFTKGAYFSSTPWVRYAADFIYGSARYLFWTSPFIVFFLFSWRRLREIFFTENFRFLAVAVFFSVFGLAYMLFMSTQGRAAYQILPASAAFFGLFSFLATWLLVRGGGELLLRKRGCVLMTLFALSYFVTVSRWERFVRGIVEPYRAVANLLVAGGPMNLVVPVGELRGHMEVMAQSFNPEAKIFDADAQLPKNLEGFRGKAFLIEFPYYMGELGAQVEAVRELAGGWEAISDGGSYRIYRWKKKF